MSMIQAGIIAVIGAVLAVQLKAGKAEYGIYVCVATGVILFFTDRRQTRDLYQYFQADHILYRSGYGIYVYYVQNDRDHVYCGILIGNLQRCRISDSCRTD